MRIEERLDPETIRLLREAFTHHPEFLDIWADMEAGRPEVSMDIEMSIKASNRFGRDPFDEGE